MALAIPIPDELVEQFAQAVAARAVEILGERLEDRSPWMGAEQAADYCAIPFGMFEKRAAKGEIPRHSAGDGRRYVYHRDELDSWLGYARAAAPAGAVTPLRSRDAA